MNIQARQSDNRNSPLPHCHAAQSLTAFKYCIYIHMQCQEARCIPPKELRVCHMLFCSRNVRAYLQTYCLSMHGGHKQV